jgi:hypothetical protein
MKGDEIPTPRAFLLFGIVIRTVAANTLVNRSVAADSDFLNKPKVSVKIVPDINGTSIELTNNGRVPATNFILTIDSTANIADYTFSLQKIGQ